MSEAPDPKNVTSTEFQNRTGRYLEESARSPVFITRHKRPIRVLIDIEEYQRLAALDQVALHPRDLPDEVLARMARPDIPEEAKQFDHEYRS